jgi:hypothetical protein
MTTTKESLQELRGVIASTIMGDTRFKETFPFEHPSWVNETVTRIIIRGYVTTPVEFRRRWNKFMENPPKDFSLHQLRLLEHACGCPLYEWEKLPVYDWHLSQQARLKGVSDEEMGKANRRHTEAFSKWCREADKMLQTFGGEKMCEAFEERKENGVPELVASKDGLSPLPPDSTRIVFRTTAELKEFEVNEEKWNEILETNVMIRQKSLEGYLVIDIVPVYVWDKLEAEKVGVKSYESGSHAA